MDNIKEKIEEKKNLIKKGIKRKKTVIKDTFINRKNGFKLVEVIIIAIVTLSIGIGLGIGVVFTGSNNYNSKYCDDNVKLDDNAKEIIDTYNSILDNYYTNIDKDALTNSAIKAMLETLGDPYSLYMDDDQTTSFNDRMQGDYQGIGVEISITTDSKIVAINVFKNSPAAKAGMLPLDIITAVDGKSIKNMTTADVAVLLKGPKGSQVKVKILRGTTEKELTITRDRVIIQSVSHQVFNRNTKKIGYVKIDIFSDNTYDQFRTAITDLEKQNINSLIIDVRDNSGGYLNRVSEMISMFLPKDKIIYQLQDKNNTQKIYSYTNEKRTYPVAVLINKASASASEILAAAFKESYGATIVGVNSYGKGTVQQTFILDTGGMVKYTVQKWLTPNGNWINNVGVKPDVVVEQDEKYYENPTVEKDAQLNKALEILNTK